MRLFGSWHAKLLIAALMLAIPACGIEEAQQQRQAQIKAAEVSMDINHIFVAVGDTPEPHDVLGKLEYSELVSGESIDEATQDAKIRKMAIERWPAGVA